MCSLQWMQAGIMTSAFWILLWFGVAMLCMAAIGAGLSIGLLF
jgi:hypothetical protein